MCRLPCFIYLMCCAKLFVTLWTVAHQAPLSMGILQARILECVAMSSSRGSSNPGIKPRSSALQANSLLSEPPGKVGQQLAPSWQSLGAGGWLHHGVRTVVGAVSQDPCWWAACAPRNMGGSNLYLHSGPSAVAEGSSYYPIGFLYFFFFFHLTFCLLF